MLSSALIPVEAALDLAARGFRVFRVIPNGKRPAFPGWQTEATTDEGTLRRWWPSEFNIGVATGSGLVVLDIDVKNGVDGFKALHLLEMLYEDLAPTLTVRTPSGGEHRYFRTSTEVACSVSKIGTGLDVRGAGGLVVGPGSMIDGRAYAIS